MSLPVIKNFSIKIVDSIKQWTLNYTDIVANSNKVYSLEIVKGVDDKFYLFTSYGRLGGTMCQEYRLAGSLSNVESEAANIIKSKVKK